MCSKYKIIITGGSGRFGSALKKKYYKNNFFYPSKKELNILSEISIQKYIKKIKPKILIHLAGLSRPMKVHEKNITNSIDLNIIGTANIVKICKKFNVKLIFFSTNYVYPGKKGNYKETDSLLPINNYAWSKLGAESSVQMYKNSLILRVCMTERPFLHKKVFKNVKTNFLYHDEIVSFLFKLVKFRGILNVGGKIHTLVGFAKKIKKKIVVIDKKNSIFKNYPNTSINTDKLKKILKKTIN